jgi:hypothetical protein
MLLFKKAAMKNNKFQHIRLRVSAAGETIRFNATCDKGYKNLKGIFVSLPQDKAIQGATLGFRLNNVEILDDGHEVKNLTASNNVAPDNKYFLFPELIDANGASIEGRYSDGSKYPLLVDNGDDTGVFDAAKINFRTLAGYNQNPNSVVFPYDVVINLWLNN